MGRHGNRPAFNGLPGDGLTVFEEYRGFMVKGTHTRTLAGNPLDKKDLFIYSEFTQGYGRAANLPSPFRCHLINESEMSNIREINFNVCVDPVSGKKWRVRGASGARGQKAVRVENGSTKREAARWAADFGVVLNSATVPYKVQHCYVYPDTLDASLKKLQTAAGPDANFRDTHYARMLEITIGHEIGHCLAVNHPTADTYDALAKTIPVLALRGHGHSIMEEFVGTTDAKNREIIQLFKGRTLRGYPI